MALSALSAWLSITFHHTSLLKAPSSLPSSTNKDGASTDSPNLLQKGFIPLNSLFQSHDSSWNSIEQFLSISRSRLIILWEETFYLAFNFSTAVMYLYPVLVFFSLPFQARCYPAFYKHHSSPVSLQPPSKGSVPGSSLSICFAMQVESQWPWMIHLLDKPPEDCIISGARLPVRCCNTRHRCLFLTHTSLGKSILLFSTSIT